MLNDLYEILKESLKKLLASRTFILGVFFVFLFGVLAVQLFKLQIIEGEDAKDILDAIRKAKTDNIYIITWIHTFNDMQKQARLKEKEEQ